MKKKIIAIFLVCMAIMTGCQGKEEAKVPSEEQEVAEQAENDEDKAAALEEALGDYIIEPNDALKSVFSRTWNVTGTEDVYVLEIDGTGMKNEEALTYECGFDEDNQIILKFIMDGETEGITYIADADATGYGLDLTPAAEGTAMNLFPSNMTLLEVSDEKAKGLVGCWKDENANEYVFEENGELIIKGKETDTPGSWCAVEKDGVLHVNLLVEGGSLEFEYEIQEEGKTLALYNRSAESWYYWYK